MRLFLGFSNLQSIQACLPSSQVLTLAPVSFLVPHVEWHELVCVEHLLCAKCLETKIKSWLLVTFVKPPPAPRLGAYICKWRLCLPSCYLYFPLQFFHSLNLSCFPFPQRPQQGLRCKLAASLAEILQKFWGDGFTLYLGKQIFPACSVFFLEKLLCGKRG